MCGKFTAQASWREVVAFSQALTGSSGEGGGGARDVTYRVNSLVPGSGGDEGGRQRGVGGTRSGSPDPRDWRRPRPIHARAESVDQKEQFRKPFHAGQRGIVLFRTFNEGEEVMKPSGKTETVQWTI